MMVFTNGKCLSVDFGDGLSNLDNIVLTLLFATRKESIKEFSKLKETKSLPTTLMIASNDRDYALKFEEFSISDCSYSLLERMGSSKYSIAIQGTYKNFYETHKDGTDYYNGEDIE